jgi:nicotinate-nucleotide pyrophosphorylase
MTYFKLSVSDANTGNILFDNVIVKSRRKNAARSYAVEQTIDVQIDRLTTDEVVNAMKSGVEIVELDSVQATQAEDAA